MTLLAIPVESPDGMASKVNEHFARSEDFALIEAEKGRVASCEIVHYAPSTDQKKAGFLADRGVEAILAGRIGACMTRIFHGRGVRIFTGAGGTIQDAVDDFEAGKLAEALPNPYQI